MVYSGLFWAKSYDSGPQPSPYYAELIMLFILGLFQVYFIIELALVRGSVQRKEGLLQLQLQAYGKEVTTPHLAQTN